MMTHVQAPAVVWLRHDLRLEDNAALVAASGRGPVVPVFVWAPAEEGPWQPGAASRWWLHRSLASLGSSLERAGSRLVLRRGPTLEALRAVAAETGADRVVWSRRYEPAAGARDAAVEAGLREQGIATETVGGSLLCEPWEVETAAGRPFRVFTPFWRACLARPAPPRPLPPPRLAAPARWPEALPLAALSLEPGPQRAAGLESAWQPGESAARERLAAFAAGPVSSYEELRDRVDLDGTSRLSPHLRFGELSPRQIWHALAGLPRAEPFLRQLGWREFAYHLLHHFPHTPEQPLREAFAAFPWEDDPAGLEAWHRGLTGFPLVDAGMRQLTETGWLPNRARMVTASFLAKDLLVPWQDGARWFWENLVDADLASNTLGWQWVAGSGADAAPYFRVFNPSAQAARHDPEGAYARHFLPELDGQAGAYPEPIVDHARARERALAAFATLRAQ